MDELWKLPEEKRIYIATMWVVWWHQHNSHTLCCAVEYMQVCERTSRMTWRNWRPPTTDVSFNSVWTVTAGQTHGDRCGSSDHQGMVVAAWAGRQEHIGSALTAELQAVEEAIREGPV
jgi:hypothetical protein